jgi:hypothetical protein
VLEIDIPATEKVSRISQNSNRGIVPAWIVCCKSEINSNLSQHRRYPLQSSRVR